MGLAAPYEMKEGNNWDVLTFCPCVTSPPPSKQVKNKPQKHMHKEKDAK